MAVAWTTDQDLPWPSDRDVPRMVREDLKETFMGHWKTTSSGRPGGQYLPAGKLN